MLLATQEIVSWLLSSVEYYHLLSLSLVECYHLLSLITCWVLSSLESYHLLSVIISWVLSLVGCYHLLSLITCWVLSSLESYHLLSHLFSHLFSIVWYEQDKKMRQCVASPDASDNVLPFLTHQTIGCLFSCIRQSVASSHATKIK